jgi:PAS domain S-box-containing protein
MKQAAESSPIPAAANGQALRTSELSYRRLFEAARDGILILDIDTGRIADVNPFLVELLGFSHDEMLGKTVAELSPFKDILSNQAMLARLQKDGYVRYEDLPLETRDGRKIAVEFVSNVYQAGDKKVIQCNIRDITERKRVDAALIRLGAIVESSDDAIIGKDIHSIVTSWNKGAEKIFGFTAAEMVGTSIMRLIPADRQDEENQLMAKVMRGERGRQVETVRQAKDGRLINVSVTVSPIKDASGKIVGVSKVARDITERKKAEEVLRQVSRQEAGRKKAGILTEMAVIFAATILFVAISYYTDAIQAPIDKFFNQLKEQEHLDELLIGLTVLALGFFIFSYRRWREAHSKVGEQANIQEALRILHGELEKRIQQRTGELTEANDALQMEITEHQRAEDARRASDERMRLATEATGVGIWELNVLTNKIRWDTQMFRIYGATPTPDGFVDYTIWSGSVLPEELARQEAILQDTIRRGGRNTREFRILRRDDREGRQIEAVETVRLNDRGQAEWVVGTNLDITERKRAEESLRLLGSAMEQSKESVTITDAELDLPGPKIIFVNPAFTQMTGYTAEEVIGKTPRILQGPRTDKAVLARLRKNLEQGEMFEGEAINYRKDGTEYDLEWQIAPIRDPGGKITHYVATQHDITGRKKLEAQLRQSQKMEAIGTLAGGVAHDFNNILAVIQMQASLLKRADDLSAGQSELADGIGIAVQRAVGLTRQLLMFSRKGVLQSHDLDLNQSVAEMTKMLTRILGENIAVQLKLAAQPMFLHADAGMMDQILMNLAVNARDAMPEGGQLVIETAGVEFDEFAATQTAQARPGSFVRLSVSDNGCGIPPENLAKIFEPFFTTKGVGKGTGLGLATVFGIAKQHQGWVNVYSEVGHGTTFKVYLPRLEEAQDTKIIFKKMLATAQTGHETILLVEDEPALRTTINLTLSRLGYRVLEASTGFKALEVWKEHPAEIHLLLTDLMMPDGITGKELGQRLLQENPKLKVIYMSGYSADIVAKDFPLQEGVNFLTKPFQVQHLAQTIRQSLDAAAIGT